MSGVRLGDLPLSVIVAGAALIVLELSLRIFALVQLARTAQERVTLGGRKWLWALIIALLNTAGWILWFVLGRKPASATVAASAPADKIEAAADALYPQAPSDAASPPAVDPPPQDPNSVVWDEEPPRLDDSWS